jgi:hypothetical protein
MAGPRLVFEVLRMKVFLPALFLLIFTLSAAGEKVDPSAVKEGEIELSSTSPQDSRSLVSERAKVINMVEALVKENPKANPAGSGEPSANQ